MYAVHEKRYPAADPVISGRVSAGALFGGAFLHLIPEAIEQSSLERTTLLTITGFCFFFLLERCLWWRHCHTKAGACEVHTLGYMNLIGDGIHNLIDGLIIAAGFFVDIRLGIVTTVAVIMHEIPQEIGDFGVLLYSGLSRSRALLFNFLSAAVAIVGALVGTVLCGQIPFLKALLLPFAAGGFIYIAACDLIPELHKEPDIKRSFFSFAFFLAGVMLMFTMRLLFE